MTLAELHAKTPEERWNLFSCGSRCLMKLVELHGKPSISKDDLLAQFAYLFQPLHEGLTNTAELIEIAKGLGLCKSAIVLRDVRKVKDMRAKKEERGILVLTDRNPDDNNADLFHCRLLCGFDDTNVALFSPFQDGTAPTIPDTWGNLEKQLVHFLLLVGQP
jgi:hypothetical protein